MRQRSEVKMKTTMQLFLCLALLLSGCRSATAQQPQPWKEFRSDSGFAVPYPSTWTRIGVETARLDLLGPRKEGRAEGVVIGKGQVEILVSKIDLRKGDTLEGLIARDNKFSSGIEIKNDLNDGSHRVVSYKEEEGPKTFSLTTKIYRALGAGSFSCVSVRYWLDDPNGDRYRKIAEYMSSHTRRLASL